jgi:cytochrome c553
LKRRAPCLFAALLVVSAPLAAAADGDAENGRKLAYACLGCHGIENYKNAYPNYSVPKLGGQNRAYVVAALGGYKDGARWHPTMHGYASTLTKQDRADLAAYFSAAVPKGAGGEVVGTPPEKASTCVACHGNNGNGTMDEYPDLAGQHADYLAQALNDYRRGKRKNPIMQPFAQQLTQDEIQALAKFFSAQKGVETLAND